MYNVHTFNYNKLYLPIEFSKMIKYLSKKDSIIANKTESLVKYSNTSI